MEENKLHHTSDTSDELNDVEIQDHNQCHKVSDSNSPNPNEESNSNEGRTISISSIKRFYFRYRLLFDIFICLLITAWYISALILHLNEARIIVTLIWSFIILKFFFWHVSTKRITPIISKFWNYSFGLIIKNIPKRFQLPLGILIVVASIFLTGFLLPLEPGQSLRLRAQAIFGLVIFIGILFATSNNIRAINYQTVLVGIFMQFIIALFVLRTQAGYDLFKWMADTTFTFLNFSSAGYDFIFSSNSPQNFASAVFPTIIYFVAFVSFLYYIGVMQWLIKKFAWFFLHTMNVSGAEAIVAAASPFIGQAENAVLITPYIPLLTKSEIHQIMTSGFGTISGSVLKGYISLGVPGNHIITACIMSVPASLAVSKIRYPETEEPLTKGRIVIPHQDPKEKPYNWIHAFSKGSILGLWVVFYVAANLLVVVSVVAFINSIFGWIGHFISLPQLSLNLIAGYIFYPFAWLMSIENKDLYIAGKLLGEKIIQNEFVAYTDMTHTYQGQLSERSINIITYALCGFSNFASLGVQIGVLSQLGPSRQKEFTELAFSAMLCGMMSTYLTATITGILM